MTVCYKETNKPTYLVASLEATLLYVVDKYCRTH